MRSELVRRPIDVSLLIGEAASAGRGATAVFVGTVRDFNDGRAVTGIEYSAYDAMAEREMMTIAVEAESRHGPAHIIVEHRLGMLAVGETSIAIAVAHERRAPALDAMRYMIEEFKRRVPIWKLEHYVDGTREWTDPAKAHPA